MVQEAKVAKRGVYNIEYFSGAQVSLYIGDVWVDEVTTLSYGYQQSRTPIYGYASTLFDDVSEGHILVTGQFTINFKEAGYLWLILDRYRQLNKRRASLTAESTNPFLDSGLASRDGIDKLINHETKSWVRNETFKEIAAQVVKFQFQGGINVSESALSQYTDLNRSNARTSLGGFASDTRAAGSSASIGEKRSLGAAEGKFEAFEDLVWQEAPEVLDEKNRRADDPRLNPFEIYVAFGDFAGDNTANHTIERLRNVFILGKSKQIVIDGMPIQEQYSFLARNIV